MTIVWDWNGTLLDDTEASVAALNDQLRRRGLPVLSLATYRETFAFPVRPFYERCGLDLAHEDWEALAQDYHDAYHARPVRLNVEARAALELAQAAGFRQTIVSALRQDHLDAAIDRFGLRTFFTAVVGSTNQDGGSKLVQARALVDRLRAAGETRFVMIGDALHDREVAAALSIECVLFGGGSHAFHRLAAVAPTVATLTEALRGLMQ